MNRGLAVAALAACSFTQMFVSGAESNASQVGEGRHLPSERYSSRYASHCLGRFSKAPNPEADPDRDHPGVWKKANGPNDVILAKMGGPREGNQRGRRHERQPCLH